MNEFLMIILAKSRRHDAINLYSAEQRIRLKKIYRAALDQIDSRQEKLIITESRNREFVELRPWESIFLNDFSTEGALISLAWALDQVPSDTPILLTNVDGISDVPLEIFVDRMNSEGRDLGVIGFKSEKPIFSFFRVFDSQIVEFAEKKVIGSLALTGTLYFRRKEMLINCIEWSLLNRVSTNGVFYLAPALNYFVSVGASIGYEQIDPTKYYRFAEENTWIKEFERWEKREKI